MGVAPAALVIVVAGLLALGLYLPPPKAVNTDYLLTVLAAIGTFAGFGFALYGWYTVNRLPRLVDERVRERVKAVQDSLRDIVYRQQEAMQKVIASYQLADPDQRISLLKQAVEIDPTVYNGFNALGYAYLEKGDYLAAEESFRQGLKYHPDNEQSACDLVYLFAAQKEWLSALSWMKEAIRINPRVWEYFDKDGRLDELRSARAEEYKKIIEEAKAASSTITTHR